MEIADNLNDEGAVAKAGAVYKKILKLKPDHERGLWQVSDILGNQGLYADARAHLNTLIELRRAQGRHARRAAGEDPARLARPGRLRRPHGRRPARASRWATSAARMSDLKDMAGELADKGPPGRGDRGRCARRRS